MQDNDVRPPAPAPITEADRARLREENAAHDAEVMKWAKEQRERDIAAGIAPAPVVQSVADMIKKKLETGDIHDTAEREQRERELLGGGETA